MTLAPPKPAASGEVSDPQPAAPAVSAANRHIRGSALLLSGRVISLGLNLATQVLTVRYLSKLEYGAFAFAYTMAALASSLSVFGLDKTSARFTAILHERGEYGKLFGTLFVVFGLILSVGTAIVLAVLGFRGLIGSTIASGPLSLSLLLILISLAPIQALDSALVSLFAVFSGARAVFFRRHLLGPGLKLAAVALVMAVQGNAQVLAVAYVAAGLLGIVLYVVLLLHVLRRQGLLRHFDRQSVRYPLGEVVKFTLPLFFSDLAFLFRGAMAVLFLEMYQHSSAVADFRSVFPLARLNQAVLQSFTFLFIPLTARLLARKNDREIADVYWRSVLWITVVSFPLFAVTFALAEPVAVLLFGTRYARAGDILSILAIGFYAHSAAGLNSRTLKVYGKLRYIIVIDAVVTVFALSAYLVLIPRYGALGAAMALCASLLVHNVANQIGLWLGTGISAFGRRYVTLYAGVAAVAAVFWQIQSLASPPLYVGFPLAALASLAVFLMNRNRLNVESTFPELGKVPVLRRALGFRRDEPSTVDHDDQRR